jgi:hypothetical protein
MEDIELVKKITNSKPIVIRTNGPTNIRWKNGVINDLRK